MQEIKEQMLIAYREHRNEPTIANEKMLLDSVTAWGKAQD